MGDKLWSLVSEQTRTNYAKNTDKAPVIDIVRAGYYKVLGKGILPKQPVIVKSKFQCTQVKNCKSNCFLPFPWTQIDACFFECVLRNIEQKMLQHPQPPSNVEYFHTSGSIHMDSFQDEIVRPKWGIHEPQLRPQILIGLYLFQSLTFSKSFPYERQKSFEA